MKDETGKALFDLIDKQNHLIMSLMMELSKHQPPPENLNDDLLVMLAAAANIKNMLDEERKQRLN